MYIKLEDIVNDLLVEEGKTSENDFLRYFKLGLNGLKELHFDVGGNIKTIELIVSPSTLTVDLPSDYVRYTKIGLLGNDGDVHSLGLRNDKSLNNTTPTSTSVSDDELHPTYFEYVQEFGLGGGNNTNGYYKVDLENSTIQFTSDLSGEKIILEYISNSAIHSNENAVVVHEFAVDAMKAYIFWKSIQRRRNYNSADRQEARAEYYNNKRLARARLLSFNKQEALQTTRKSFKQSPKL